MQVNVEMHTLYFNICIYIDAKKIHTGRCGKIASENSLIKRPYNT